MITISYHPAFDAYHATLRLLQIVHFNPLQFFEYDRLRIIDFYYTFPQQIKFIRLPKKHSKEQKRVAADPNQYHFSGTTPIVFSNMAPWQGAAIRLLRTKNLIDPSALRERDLVVVASELPPILRELVSIRSASTKARLSFLINVLGEFPLRGKDGLKDRTGLLNYKYDSI